MPPKRLAIHMPDGDEINNIHVFVSISARHLTRQREKATRKGAAAKRNPLLPSHKLLQHLAKISNSLTLQQSHLLRLGAAYYQAVSTLIKRTSIPTFLALASEHDGEVFSSVSETLESVRYIERKFLDELVKQHMKLRNGDDSGANGNGSGGGKGLKRRRETSEISEDSRQQEEEGHEENEKASEDEGDNYLVDGNDGRKKPRYFWRLQDEVAMRDILRMTSDWEAVINHFSGTYSR